MSDRPELLPVPQSSASEAALAKTPGALVQAFLAGRTEQTFSAYRKDLQDFTTFLGKSTPEEACALLLSLDGGRANALALAYRQDLQKRKLSAATTNRRLAALRSLLRLARMLGLVSFTLEVESLKAEPYRDTRGPGKDGVKALLAELDGRKDPKAQRDRAILRLLYDLALRTSEVVSLDKEHVDLPQRTLWVLGKGRSARQRVTLPLDTRDALAAWLKVRGDEPGPLFQSLDNAHPGLRLSPTSLYRVVRRLGEQAGLRARPHGLRHAAITEALDQTGGDVRAVARFSRHKDLRVLCVYDDARKDIAGEISSLVARSTRGKR